MKESNRSSFNIDELDQVANLVISSPDEQYNGVTAIHVKTIPVTSMQLTNESPSSMYRYPNALPNRLSPYHQFQNGSLQSQMTRSNSTSGLVL